MNWDPVGHHHTKAQKAEVAAELEKIEFERRKLAKTGMTTPREQAELINRLEEIMESEYGPLDTEKIEADMKILAVALLSILRRPEEEVFKGKHIFGMDYRCMNCGNSRRALELNDRLSWCTGELL